MGHKGIGATTSTKCIYLLLVLAVTITGSVARPQNAIDSQQEAVEYDPDVAEVRNNYYPYPNQEMLDSIPLERLQMLVAQMRPSAYLRGFNGGSSMDNLYRMPETKRQVRYRQCYFNPISCFRK